MFITNYDSGKAIIEPSRVIAKADGMPKICIGVFSHLLVEEWAAKYGAEIIALIESASGDKPVYKIAVDNYEFALFVPHVGAPAAVGCMEVLIAKGVETFIFCGSCGVLRHDIADGHLIVPTAAIRDEGTSYHYVEPADEIALEAGMITLASETLEALALPFVRGKTWTTDAFYRETPKKMERAKTMGAICVDMECASLAAVAKFRRVSFVQFFWSADSLASPKWEKRGLSAKGLPVSEKCMLAAIEITKRLTAL